MLSISQLQIPAGQTLMLTDSFRNLIENHLPYLRTHSATVPTLIEDNIADKYMGDFYQLLNYLKVNQELFWVTLRVNNLLSPLDYDGSLTTVLIPSSSVIHTLLNRFLNSTQLS